jgi:hypothetical protein
VNRTPVNGQDRREVRLAEQMKELLYVGFYILYVAFFFVLLAEKGKWHAAYRANPFEMEAYDYQGDIRYLEHRKKFSWKKYV